MEIKLSALQIHTLTVSMKLNHKNLLTSPTGEQRILFSSNLNVPLDLVLGNIEIQGKQNSLFPKGPVITSYVR